MNQSFFSRIYYLNLSRPYQLYIPVFINRASGRHRMSRGGRASINRRLPDQPLISELVVDR
jgi:hypothetical protein